MVFFDYNLLHQRVGGHNRGNLGEGKELGDAIQRDPRRLEIGGHRAHAAVTSLWEGK